MFKITKQPPKYMFWLAIMFGERLSPVLYYWRGHYWLMGDVECSTNKSGLEDK